MDGQFLFAFVAAPRHGRIDAPYLLDGPINGERFLLAADALLSSPAGTPILAVDLLMTEIF
jgi:hypothetical protein